MNTQLSAKDQGKKIQPDPSRNQNHGTATSQTEGEKSLPAESVYSLFDAAGRLDNFRMRKMVYEKGSITICIFRMRVGW